MSTETFRWGILGAGQIAVKFCDAVKSIADCTVAAVGSKSFSRAETFARENGISRWYGDYEELLKKERPDAVYIAATSNDHYRLTMMALDYEIPVYVKKQCFRTAGRPPLFCAFGKRKSICHGSDVEPFSSGSTDCGKVAGTGKNRQSDGGGSGDRLSRSV